MKYLLLYTFLIIFSGCQSQECNKISNHFTSYEQAIIQISHADFKINESVNTSKSSWVQSAHYYSCNGVTGYFIIEANNKKYIHKDVPIDVWNEFKNANSFGTFYNSNIRRRYRLNLN